MPKQRRHQVSFKSLTVLSFSAEILAVGSAGYEGMENVKTEMYSTKVGSWKPLEDYPIDSNRETEYLGMYAALYHDGAFYVFGGWAPSASVSTTIARLDTKTTKWSKGGCHQKILKFLLSCSLGKAGTLKNGRRGHSAIFDGEKFWILGGVGTVGNEACTLDGSTVTCVEQPTFFYQPGAYPELFLVADDFGRDVDKC